MMHLFYLVVLIVILQQLIEDDSFVVYAKIAVLLYLLHLVFTKLAYIKEFFRIG